MTMASSELSQQETYSAYSVFKSGVVSNSNNFIPVPYPDFNETICFGGDSTNFMDTIYNSKVRETLNLPIYKLTNDSDTSRLAERNRRNEERGVMIKIPRPQNAWIIYRRNITASGEYDGLKSAEISVKVGELWRNETKEVHEYFVALSLLASENHFQKYGKEYKYKPKQRARKLANNKQKKEQIKENIKSKTVVPTPSNPPQLSVTPPSSNNEYGYPTPASSIQHSPIPLPSSVNYEYPPTPTSTIQYSPPTSEKDFLIDNLFDLSDDDFGLDQLMKTYQAVPPLSDINTLNSNESFFLDEKLSEFLSNAENLTIPAVTTITPELYSNGCELPTNAPLESTTTNITPELYSNGCELLTNAPLESTTTNIPPELYYNGCDAPLESTVDMSIQNSVTNGDFFGYNGFNLHDPEWHINDAPLYPDQMDYVSDYTVINQPSL